MAREALARSLAADASTRYLVLTSIDLNDSSSCLLLMPSVFCVRLTSWLAAACVHVCVPCQERWQASPLDQPSTRNTAGRLTAVDQLGQVPHAQPHVVAHHLAVEHPASSLSTLHHPKP
jgi:hypothetical protein